MSAPETPPPRRGRVSAAASSLLAVTVLAVALIVWSSTRTVNEAPDSGANQSWSLLATVDRAAPPAPLVITELMTFERFWTELETSQERPAVDFANNVVIAFPSITNASPACPDARLVDMAIGSDRIEPIIADPEFEPVRIEGKLAGCQTLAVPRVSVALLARSALPSPPYVVGIPDEPTTAVKADLSTAGAELDASDVSYVLDGASYIPDG